MCYGSKVAFFAHQETKIADTAILIFHISFTKALNSLKH